MISRQIVYHFYIFSFAEKYLLQEPGRDYDAQEVDARTTYHVVVTSHWVETLLSSREGAQRAGNFLPPSKSPGFSRNLSQC